MTGPTDAEIRGLAATGNGVYQDDETAIWEITDPSLLKFARAVLAKWGQPAQAAEPVAWYEGNPPFPQDQEWFIAETIYGDKAVLRSLDEGREHKGNYAFKTADETYMKAEIIKRWMQFPDCEYLPPTAPQPVAREPLSDEQIEALPIWKRFVGLWPETRREIVRIIEAQHGIKGGQHGTDTRTN